MDEKTRLDIFGFDVADNVLYFSGRQINAIFSMDLNSGAIKYRTVPEKYHLYDRSLFQDAKISGQKIWFVPYVADSILIYDMIQNTCKYIDIPNMNGHGRSTVKFGGLYDDGGWFVLIPAEYPAILKINKETYDMVVIRWEEELLKKYPDFLKINKSLSIARSYEVHEEKLYLLVENVVIKYDMRTDEISFVQMNGDARLYTGIAKYENVFILVERIYSKLVVWNEAYGQVRTTDINLGYRGISAGDDGCPLELFQVNEGIVVVQANANFLLLVNKSDIIRKIYFDIERKQEKDVFFTRVKQIGNRLIFPLDGKNAVLLVNTDDWTQQYVKMDLLHFDFEPVMIELEKELYMLENDFPCTIYNFIETVCRGEKTGIAKAEECNIGESIFSNTK